MDVPERVDTILLSHGGTGAELLGGTQAHNPDSGMPLLNDLARERGFDKTRKVNKSCIFYVAFPRARGGRKEGEKRRRQMRFRSFHQSGQLCITIDQLSLKTDSQLGRVRALEVWVCWEGGGRRRTGVGCSVLGRDFRLCCN